MQAPYEAKVEAKAETRQSAKRRVCFLCFFGLFCVWFAFWSSFHESFSILEKERTRPNATSAKAGKARFKNSEVCFVLGDRSVSLDIY